MSGWTDGQVLLFTVACVLAAISVVVCFVAAAADRLKRTPHLPPDLTAEPPSNVRPFDPGRLTFGGGWTDTPGRQR